MLYCLSLFLFSAVIFRLISVAVLSLSVNYPLNSGLGSAIDSAQQNLNWRYLDSSIAISQTHYFSVTKIMGLRGLEVNSLVPPSRPQTLSSRLFSLRVYWSLSRPNLYVVLFLLESGCEPCHSLHVRLCFLLSVQEASAYSFLLERIFWLMPYNISVRVWTWFGLTWNTMLKPRNVFHEKVRLAVLVRRECFYWSNLACSSWTHSYGYGRKTVNLGHPATIRVSSYYVPSRSFRYQLNSGWL